MCINQEQLADAVCRTVVSYQTQLHTETELLMQVKKLLFDNVYLPKVNDDKKSWFPLMEVLDQNLPSMFLYYQ